jgi:cohesin complex subunit SA-1/2
MGPVRFLEAQMACLNQTFNDWINVEPELENDRPTDDELAAFEEAEKKHAAMFETMEQLATRLSSSLGVGKINDTKVVQALRGFIREGVRFAFSTEVLNDEELPVGSRLSFLRILSK